MTSQKSPSGPKGCPNGCGQSRCQQVSPQRHQLLKSLLQPQTMVSFVSVLMHCEPCRIQHINRRSLRWQMNTVPPSRKKCFWLVGSSSWTSRSGKGRVRWIRWRLRTEICPSSFSIFKRCFRTQANKCKTPKRNWASYKQSVPKWSREFVLREQNDIELLLRRALPKPDETLSQHLEVVVRAAAAFVPDPQGPARQSRCIKICRRLRRKTDVGEGCTLAANEAGAVGRVSCKSQRRSFSIITANVSSCGGGRHCLEQEVPGLAVIQEHHLAHADSITEAQTWLARLGYKSIFSPALPPRLAMALLVVWLS